MQRFEFRMDSIAGCYCDMEPDYEGDYVSVADVLEFVEDVESALGCTDVDDIRNHLADRVAYLKTVLGGRS